MDLGFEVELYIDNPKMKHRIDIKDDVKIHVQVGSFIEWFWNNYSHIVASNRQFKAFKPVLEMNT